MLYINEISIILIMIVLLEQARTPTWATALFTVIAMIIILIIKNALRKK